jgi:hypothetical protein
MTVKSHLWSGQRIKKTRTTTVRYETRTTIDRPIVDVFERDWRTSMVTGRGCIARACSAGPVKALTVVRARAPRTSTPREWARSAVR